MLDKNQLIRHDPNIENHHLLHINRLPARATVIPAEGRGVYYRNKEDSSRVRSLNGDFRFLYRLEDTEEGFFAPDLDDTAWNTIDVPSMWQYRGWGAPEYPNVRYSFPFMPPYILKPNPVGYYRRTFPVDTPAEKTILHFSGVDNAFYVYLNGRQVGFSKGSRLPAEFDVTPYLVAGENLLAVKVFTYSDASYLENQDMLLASGIFRDVYLIESASDTLWDYRIRTTYDSISVEAKLCVRDGCDVRFTLGDESVTYAARETLSHTFSLSEPKLWTAETPNLYDLYIELLRDGKVIEVHSKRVGILHTRCEGNKFLVNERPIYVKGVNRHENNAKNGRAITVAEIEADLRMIKANNLNAIRLSHYTNNPATYEIASELGLYLMDEADLETHGATIANGDEGYLSKDADWYDAYRDRVERMLEVNKNETCIFIHSLGNECGRGENLIRLLDVVRAFDPTRECVTVQDNGEYINFRLIGYYPMSVPKEMDDDGKPILAVEYAHAMGNSPGTLEDYWDYNYTHEKMCGGFVWEFRSHGFYAEDDDGTPYYKYGGDFADDYHWCNFNMDGYCLSDGRPKPAWHELGTVSFAAYTTFDGERITVKNTNDFLTLSYLEAKYEIACDGTVVKSAPLALPEILPHESYTFRPDLTVEAPIPGARYYVNVLYFEKGRQVHKKQFSLGTLDRALPYTPPKARAEITVESYVLSVRYGDFLCQFTKGMLSRIEKGGKVLLDAPMRLNLHRAPTDNDGIRGLFPRHIGEWEAAGLRNYFFALTDMTAEERTDRVVVTVSGSYTANAQFAGFFVRLTYEVCADGRVLVTLKGDPYGAVPYVLPRIGVVLEMASEFERAKWLGRGPYESYPDMLASAPVGIYDKRVDELYTDFDYPQETGNHEGVYALTVYEKGGDALSVVGSDVFSFSYHDFTLDNLTDARHKNELKKSGKNSLYIDYKMRPLGSHSCGPEPEPEYELHPHRFTFAFALSACDFDGALSASRLDFGAKTEALGAPYVYDKPERIPEIADCDL